MAKYDVRKKDNEESLAGAENFAQPWDGAELDVLVSCWTTDPAGLKVLAEQLGRTVEACRQRYYLYQNGKARAQEKKAEAAVKIVDKWTKGFTSLEEMGY
jgi:hypothetical protein